MEPALQQHNPFQLTSLQRIMEGKTYRKSICALPFKQLNISRANTTAQLVSKRTSLGKTLKKISIRNNKVNQFEVKTIKDLGNKSNFFDEHLSDLGLLKDYKIMSHIGKGSFSTVSLAIHKQTNRNYAIKTYEKLDSLEMYRLESIKREIKHLKNLHHENVISLLHVFKDKKKLYLLMDNGGKQSLSGLLRKSKSFTEQRAKLYFKQIIEAINYCHGKGVCHRDIKPENILVDNEDNVKVIDFGFSANSNNRLKSYCGTPPFMSPQITKKIPYNGAAADVWSLGVLLYQLVVGTLPFRATNEQQLNRLIQQGKYPVKEFMSKNLKNILDRMLTCDASKRASASQILADEWLR